MAIREIAGILQPDSFVVQCSRVDTDSRGLIIQVENRSGGEKKSWLPVPISSVSVIGGLGGFV